MATFAPWVTVTATFGVELAGPADWGSQPVIPFAPGTPVPRGAIVTTSDAITASVPPYVVPVSRSWVAVQAHVLGAQPRLWQSDEFLHFSLGAST
jgi:hypothetical protein